MDARRAVLGAADIDSRGIEVDLLPADIDQLANPQILLGSFGMDVEDVQPVCELIRHFHSPFPPRLKFAVQTLQSLASHDGGFPPSGVLVGQFFAVVIDVWPVMIDVKEISRHGK